MKYPPYYPPCVAAFSSDVVLQQQPLLWHVRPLTVDYDRFPFRVRLEGGASVRIADTNHDLEVATFPVGVDEGLAGVVLTEQLRPGAYEVALNVRDPEFRREWRMMTNLAVVDPEMMLRELREEFMNLAHPPPETRRRRVFSVATEFEATIRQVAAEQDWADNGIEYSFHRSRRWPFGVIARPRASQPLLIWLFEMLARLTYVVCFWGGKVDYFIDDRRHDFVGVMIRTVKGSVSNGLIPQETRWAVARWVDLLAKLFPESKFLVPDWSSNKWDMENEWYMEVFLGTPPRSSVPKP